MTDPKASPRIPLAALAMPLPEQAEPPRSLLRKVGDRPTVCYCPPGICQAPKGFSGPCNRAPEGTK